MVMLIVVAVAYVILVTPISVAHLVFFILDRNIFEATEPAFVTFRQIDSLSTKRYLQHKLKPNIT